MDAAALIGLACFALAFLAWVSVKPSQRWATKEDEPQPWWHGLPGDRWPTVTWRIACEDSQWRSLARRTH